ncbi:MAG: hypothetical protein ACRDSJ_18755 [Rubrobacteraceae bacterium]
METRTENARRRESRARGTVGDALWLARRDIRSSWASFPATAGVAFVFGLLAVAQYRNALVGETGVFGEAMLDFFLLALVAVMSANLLFNRDYFRTVSDESFNGRLSFLRSMPVSAKSVVYGRVASMLLALACAAPMFFLAPYLVYGELREFVGFGGYVWYFGIWLGYAVLAVGGFVLCNFAFNWKLAEMWLPAAFAILGAYISIVLASNILLENGLALSLMELAKTSGAMAALASILTGSAALAVCASISAKRLERRDVG